MARAKALKVVGRLPVRPMSTREEYAAACMDMFCSLSAAQDALLRFGEAVTADLTIPSAEWIRPTADELLAALKRPGIIPEFGFEVQIPLWTASESNERGHGAAARYKRSSDQRMAVPLVLRSKQTKPPPGPVLVTITRRTTTQLDEYNLSSALKFVTDAVAMDYLGLDDSDPRIRFRYRQERGKARDYVVTIELCWGFGQP